MNNETEFQISGREPMMWHGSARRLRFAADLIGQALPEILASYRTDDCRGDDIFVIYPYLMLCGMALENLLKGILVSRNPGSIEPTRINRGLWRGGEHPHDLLHLCKLAEMETNEVETDMLLRMSEAVHWNGRYPIPIRSGQLERTTTLHGRKRSLRTFTDRDPSLFEALYEKLRIVLEDEADSAHRRMFERDAESVD